MNFPLGYIFSKEHTWLSAIENNTAYVGITEHAQSELGEIVYVDMPQVGRQYRANEIFGSVEALKTTSDLYMPVGGEIIEVNGSLKDNPSLINSAPFTEGWIVRIKLADGSEASQLLTAEAYEKMIL